MYSSNGTSNYSLGTVATYSCNPGFVLDLSSDGSETSICEDDGDDDAEGVFTGQPPTCTRKFCASCSSRLFFDFLV